MNSPVDPTMAVEPGKRQLRPAKSGPVTTAGWTELGPVRKRWAFLVGINGYDENAITDLKYCVGDVQELAELLKSLGYAVTLLYDGHPDKRLRPTRPNITRQLAALVQTLEPADLLLIYFACHGRITKGEPALIPADFLNGERSRPAIRVSWIRDLLKDKSKTRRMVLLLDACHMGVPVRRDTTEESFVDRARRRAEGFALLAASTSAEGAYEINGHGVFSYHVLAGLRGAAKTDGVVTIAGLETYVNDGMRAWSEGKGLPQHPTALYEGRDIANLVLADYVGSAAGPAGSLPANPFGVVGMIDDPARFAGRKLLLDQLFDDLAQHRSRSLIGGSQIGKSSILSMICRLGPERLGLPPEAFIYLNVSQISSSDQFFDALCEKLGLKQTLRGYFLGRAIQGKRYVLCIDNIEKMAHSPRFDVDARWELRGYADGTNQPFTLLIASQIPLKELFHDSAERLSPLHGLCSRLDIRPFSREETGELVASYLKGTGVAFAGAEIDELHRETGGWPAEVQRAANELFQRHRAAGS